MLASLILAQSTVAFSAPADTAERLLPKLGTAMGLRLLTDRRSASQVLLIHVRSMKRDPLLKLIAQTVGGAWEPIEGGYRLVLGDEQIRTLRKTEAERRLPWIESSLRGKADSALGKAAAQIDLTEFAGMLPGERIVWSTSPTALQRRLPSRVLDLADLQSDRSDLPPVSKRKVASYGVGNFDPEPPKGNATTVWLSARRGENSRSIGLCLAVYNAKGQRVGYHEGLLAAPLPEKPALLADLAGGTIRAPKLREPAHPETSRRLGKSASIVLDGKRARVTQEGPTPSSVAKNAWARLSQPQKNEPLALTVAPILATMAGALGKDVVATLPDEAFFATDPAPATGRSVAGWLDAFARNGLTFRLEGSTLVGTPSEPASAVLRRSDRAQLRRMFASMETQGNLTFELPPPNRFETGLLPEQAQQGPNRRVRSSGDWWLAYAWSILPEEDKAKSLRGKATVRSPEFWTIVRRSFELLEQERDDMPPERLEFEPTVFLAQAEGTISAKVSESAATSFTRPGEIYPDVETGFAEVAQELAKGKDGGLWNVPFWPAVRHTIAFQVEHEIAKGDLRISTSRIVDGLEEIVRIPGPSWRAPNLFPALQQEIWRVKSGSARF